MGRDGSESAATCRRDRRSDGDFRLVVAGEPACGFWIRCWNPATVFIMNRKAAADPAKREKAENLVLMLQGAIAAATRVGLMLNVRRENLEAVLAALPALKNPTISSLSDADWVAVNTIIEESVVRQILPRLKAAMAQGIVEYPLNKIVL